MNVKNMNIKVVVAIVVFMLFGCANTEDLVVSEYKNPVTEDKKVIRDGFVGKWRSEQANEKGGINITTVHRSQDGRYLVEFTILDDDAKLKNKQEEFGYWGVSGGVYFTLFKGWIENDEFFAADPNNAYNYDAYKILGVDPDTIVYESLASGNKYQYSKIE